MKNTLNTFALITVILTALLAPSTPVCRAQSEPETANVVEVSSLPTRGNFWSMQLTNFPPLPYNPFPDRNYSGGGEGSAGETPTGAGGTPALPGKLNSYPGSSTLHGWHTGQLLL
jgi:hypothetical protein